MVRPFLAALFCVVLSVNAEARHRHHATESCAPSGDVMRPCVYQPNFLAGVKSINVILHKEITHKGNNRRHKSRVSASEEITPQVVGHPAGCPYRAFCGCGAAVRVFGHSVRDLWLAANWFKFPRTSPGAGMVAVRRHHVFVLEQHIGGDTWLAYDANSGHHATRLHARSIAGYVIVNPHGAG